MLVGHVAVGLIGKRAAPQTSLGTLTFASMLPDFLGFVFVIAGLEHWRMVPGGRGIESVELLDVGLSHSLAMDVVWGVSHWVLDFISHRPDMPLVPDATRVYGLGLWTSLPWTVVVEGGFWLASLLVYVRMTRSKNLAGVIVFWAVAALLTASWISNFTASAPPAAQSPVSGSIVALVFFSLMVAWAFWMNRLRPVIVDAEAR